MRWLPKVKVSPGSKPANHALEAPGSGASHSNSRPPVYPRSSKPSYPLGPVHVSPWLARSCSKCLGRGHLRKDYANLVRCKLCFNYGHISSTCLSKARIQRVYRPVTALEGEGPRPKDPIKCSSAPFLEQSVPKSSSSPSVNPSSPPSMANWEVDPTPFVPKGFTLVPPVPRPPLR